LFQPSCFHLTQKNKSDGKKLLGKSPEEKVKKGHFFAFDQIPLLKHGAVEVSTRNVAVGGQQ